MSKPKDVVLGRGALIIEGEHEEQHVLLWSKRELRYAILRGGWSHGGESGKLIWRPDPPKKERKR